MLRHVLRGGEVGGGEGAGVLVGEREGERNVHLACK